MCNFSFLLIFDNKFILLTIKAFKLTIQFPFEHNEVLEKQFHNVKISNIFTDTSGDDSHLHAQFTLMSTSHYTNNYILVLDECDLLERLNITHSIRLPPNKALQIEMNFTLQIYTERKQRTCYGGLIFIISIAKLYTIIRNF